MSRNLLKRSLKIFFNVKLPETLEDESFNSIVFFPFLQSIYNVVTA